jgi:hypothetical protein
MSNSNRKFFSRLLIINHFDNVINQIDIRTETLLQDKSLTKETRDKLNEIRKKQIEKIEEIMEINLNHLKNKEKTEGLEEDDEIALERLIHFDCVLLERPKSLNGLVLTITSWYFNQNNFQMLR